MMLSPTKIQRDWWENPKTFFDDVLGCSFWDKQWDIVNAIKTEKRVTVRSSNTVGKTYAVARIALWFLMCHPQSVVVTTAPTNRQIKDLLWGEIHSAVNNSKVPYGGVLNQTELRISSDCYAVGVAYKDGTETAETIQGYHAASGNILFIVDEASAVETQVFEAISGGMNSDGARLLLIGNPTRNTGYFADSFKSSLFHKIHINQFDLPNVKEGKVIVNGLATKESIAEMREEYGEKSDVYRVRVLGEFPLSDSNTKISLHLVEEAEQRDKPLLKGTDEVIGLDVARFGDDKTVFVRRVGYTGEVLEVVHTLDPTIGTMEIVGKAKRYLKRYPSARMHIDIIGIGAGVYDRLREDDSIVERVFGVNVAAQATDTEHFINLRAEAWEDTRKWLKSAKLVEHKGWVELAKPQMKYASSGKEQLEGKEEMKKRGINSPNIADALVLTLARATEGGLVAPVFM